MSIINGFGSIPDDTAYAVNRFNIPTITEESGKYVFNFNIPFSYEANKIMNIQGLEYNGVTEFENPLININGTGNRQISGTIRSGKYYNIVWTGAEWITQVTTLGVSTDQIIISSSGTYSIDPDISYNLIAVGGGGGACVLLDGYYREYRAAAGGGSGAIIRDVFIPDSSTITVEVGAAGSNVLINESGSRSNGGDTIIGGFTAGGGTGGYGQWISGSNVSVSAGSGGEYSGGEGENGKGGTYSSGGSTGSGTGGDGWTINGVVYGQGGSSYKALSSYSMTRTPTAGIIILTPIL